MALQLNNDVNKPSLLYSNFICNSINDDINSCILFPNLYIIPVESKSYPDSEELTNPCNYHSNIIIAI